jgi:hypothetical protein
MEDRSRIFSQISSPYNVFDVVVVVSLLCLVIKPLSSEDSDLGFSYSQFSDLSSLPYSSVIGACLSQGFSLTSYSQAPFYLMHLAHVSWLFSEPSLPSSLLEGLSMSVPSSRGLQCLDPSALIQSNEGFQVLDPDFLTSFLFPDICYEENISMARVNHNRRE